MPSSQESVTFVIPGDLHLTEPGLENHRAALWMIDEVNHLIRADFVQFIGDNVQHATEPQFQLFDELRGRLAVPHFALVGDHDVDANFGISGFRSHVGEPYGSTSLRGFRFLRLNTQESRPVGLSEPQISWFRREVDDAIASGERVVIFQHNYPYQIWEEFAGPGIDDWRAIVQTRRIGAIFSGHTHYGQVANDGRNVMIATRSIGDPEGGPPGYTLAHVEGEDLAITFRSIEDEGPMVLITHPRETLLATGPAHVVRGADEVRVRTWSSAFVASVRCRVDDGEWFALSSRDHASWVGPIPGDRLSKGEHAIEAEAEDERGGVATQKILFMVDPTGRFTAIPAVRPVVRETAFC